MAPKDVRPLLSAMAADSLISLQEVPKSADRNPARTFFLWYAKNIIQFRCMLNCSMQVRRPPEGLHRTCGQFVQDIVQYYHATTI